MPRLIRIVLVAALVVVATGGVRADDLDAFVMSVLQVRHIPAASLAVVMNGRVVGTAGYGVADLEHKVAASPETVYKIGSISKQFLAAGVMLLVQDGRLRITDAVSAHISDAPAPRSSRASAARRGRCFCTSGSSRRWG